MKRDKGAGQVMVEMIIIMIFVLVPLVFVTLELGQYISLSVRMSSAAREAGRLTMSKEIIPLDGVTYTESEVLATFRDEIYAVVKDMLEPSDFDQDKGYVVISILRRTDDGSSTTPVDCVVTVEDQFKFGDLTFSEFNGTPSAMYAEGDTFNGDSSDKIIEPIALDVNERTVMVELFHPLTFTDAVNGMLSATGWDYVYDYAIF
ncbi:MAG: TadE family protein [Verrucomicrobiota bacterium]